MKLLKSLKVNCTLADVIRLHGLKPGMVLHTKQDIMGSGQNTILVGDCTPFIRPTKNNGGIGWDFGKDFGLLEIKQIDFYEILDDNQEPRTCEPPGCVELDDYMSSLTKE